jgi:ubiquinone/menaquinone biosynthesis C-methylase UbiE
MSDYDTLATDYDQGRIGYANELYTTLVDYGVAPSHKILDVACGTGLASRPFIENNYDVTGVDRSETMLSIARNRLPEAQWVEGAAEALPFDAESFDVVLSAQAFHYLDRSAGVREALRVLRPGGIIAIWWKHLMNDDPVHRLRESVMQELGATPPPQGLIGGFNEFYGAALHDHTLRVLTWRTAVPLEHYLADERSHKSVQDALGANAGEYFKVFEERLRERYGVGNPLITLAYMHYVYLGKK